MTMIPLTIEELTEDRVITGEDLLRMPNIGQCELIDGRIVPMSPTNIEHAYLESRAGWYLENFVQPRKLGWVLVGEVGIYTRRDPDRVRAADVAFVSRQKLPRRPRVGYLQVAPELIIEIMSPNDSWEEVRAKVEEYVAIGVEQVWIVEPGNRQIVVFRSMTHFDTLTQGDILKGEGLLAGFELAVADLFAEG